MKEFYVMNLDTRRIAILAGGALAALGLVLFIGLAIGRSQGERQARVAAEELQQKPSESADRLVLASGPMDTDVPGLRTGGGSTRKPMDREKEAIPSVPETKSEIPLQADPLVSGPPTKVKKSAKAVKAAAADDAPQQPAKKTAKAKIKKQETEISGSVEHAGRKKRRRPAVSEEASDRLANVGTAPGARTGSTAAQYTIQVAAYKKSSEAKGLISKLKDEGIKAQYEKHGDYYLVTVGRTKSKTRLEKALARLKELEYDAYIRKLKNPASDET